MAQEASGRDRSGLVRDFSAYWRFDGLGERIERSDKTLAVGLDSVVFLVLAAFTFRTTVANPNPMGVVVVMLLLAYGWVPRRAIEHANRHRLTMLVLIAFFLGIAMPLRIGEPVMVMSFFVMLGCVASFVRFGTRATLGLVLAYIGTVVYLVVTRDWGDGSFNFALAGAVSFAGAAFILTLMLYNAFKAAEEGETGLEEARESLARLSSLSHIGYYWWDLRSDVWEMNAVYRDIMMLPEKDYPVVTVDDVFSRVNPDIRAALRERLSGPEDNDTVPISLVMPDGTHQDVMAGSKVYRHEDGHLVRHGFLWRTDRIAGLQAG